MRVADTTKETSGGLWENVKVLVQALLLALVIRTLLFQPFSIPSGSMMETLLVGDYLFVSKYSYGYSKYSIPFSPNLFSGRIFGSAPERGDVAVFRLPSDPRVDYIKRVIGLPGDRIQMKNDELYINGVVVPREQVGNFKPEGRYDTGSEVPVFRETLPNGVSYTTLDLSTNSPGDNTREFLVPEGHYFMMGDNRVNSSDSRFNVGYVPLENFVGRATIVFFSIGGDASPLELWKWPSELRLDRFFKSAQR